MLLELLDFKDLKATTTFNLKLLQSIVQSAILTQLLNRLMTTNMSPIDKVLLVN